MKLMQTRRTKEIRHIHFVYLDEESGIGISSLSKSHTHKVFDEPEVGGLRTVPAAEDNHIHEIIEIPKKRIKKNIDDDIETVNMVDSLWKVANDYEADSLEFGKQAEGYYNGDEHWKPQLKSKLEGEKRAAITVNEVEPKIDLLSGHQRETRTDFRFMPTEGGDQKVSDILTIYVHKDLSNQYFRLAETEVFDDEAIAGRGFFDLVVNTDKDIEGEIEVSHAYWDEFRLGPHKDKLLRDCDYGFKIKWQPKVIVKEKWPKKADSIDNLFMKASDADGQSSTLPPDDDYTPSPTNSMTFTEVQKQFADIAQKTVMLRELWKKEYKRIKIVFNVEDDFFYPAVDLEDKQVEELKTIEGLRVVERVQYRMKKIIVAGNVLLSEAYDEFFTDDFSFTPAYAKKRREKWWGKVKPAMGVQDEINKRHSQLMDVVTRMLPYGWFYDADTFVDPKEEQKWKDNSSTPGWTAKVDNLSKKPVKEDGVNFPNGLIQLEIMNSDKMNVIMNINKESLSASTGTQSGVALAEKRASTFKGNGYLYDNFDIAKTCVGVKYLKLLQKLKNPKKIARVVMGVENKDKFNVGPAIDGQQPTLQDYSFEDIVKIFNEADLSKYDVTVALSPHNPTAMHANFLVWSNLATQGFPIPPDVLVDMSSLPNKQKVIDAIRGQQDQDRQAEQAKLDTELQKTAMAREKKPPIEGAE